MQWHHRGSVIGSMLVVIAVIVACCVPSGCVSRAETTRYDQQFREMVLSSPIYSVTVSSVSLLDAIPGTQVLVPSQWKAVAQQVLIMSDADFEEFCRSRLSEVVAYIGNPAKGVRVQWNPDLVAKIVPLVAPDLQAAIDTQIKAQSSNDWIHQEPATASPKSLIPGFNDVTPSVVVSNTVGRIYGLYCRIHWQWDSYHITSVLPTSYGQVYAPTWTDAGLNATQGYFNADQTIYYKWVQWHFIHWSIYPGGVPLGNAYPELNIQVHAGGSWDFRSVSG
jgi:hypothetical protein